MNDDGKVYNHSEIRDILKPVFESAPIYKAVLFGSYAKGKATANSDVDLVIDSRGELLNMHFYGVLEDISTTLNKRVDLFEVSEIRPDSPIDNEIREQGMVLYDREG